MKIFEILFEFISLNLKFHSVTSIEGKNHKKINS